MTSTEIITYLAIGGGLITVFNFFWGVYSGYRNDQGKDGAKIVDGEKSVLSLGAKIDLVVSEMKHLTDSILLIKQNDLHSIYEKQRDQDAQINKHTVAIEKLVTIIEERVPRKTVESVT